MENEQMESGRKKTGFFSVLGATLGTGGRYLLTKKEVLFTLLGAILGAGGQYVLTLDQQRLELLRATRRDAYIKFLDGQVLWDLQRTPEKYLEDTAAARKRIAIYGNKAVAEAVVKYWRQHFEQPVCCGPLQKVKDDVAIYQSMRTDIMPWLEGISDADMMLLVSYCRMPESEAQVKRCPN